MGAVVKGSEASGVLVPVDPAVRPQVAQRPVTVARPQVARKALKACKPDAEVPDPVDLLPVAVVAVEGAVAEADLAVLRPARKRKRCEQHLNYPMPRREKSRRNCETFARSTARSNRN